MSKPTTREIEEVREVLADRCAPLARAAEERAYWSTLLVSVQSLRASSYPDQTVVGLAYVFLLLARTGRDRALDAVEPLPPVREVVRMFRTDGVSGETLVRAREELKRWVGTKLGSDVRHEFRFVLPRRVEEKLELHKRHAKAYEEVLELADEVWAGKRPRPIQERSSPHPTHVEVAYPDSRLAVVTLQPFGNRVRVRGESHVKLLRLVLESAGQEATWGGLQEAWASEIRGSRPDGATPTSRCLLTRDTLRKYARKIGRELGPAGCYWQRDGHGVRFAIPVKRAL